MNTYFIFDGSLVKIGRSQNPNKRLQSLQTAHHRPLTLLLELEGDRENELHQRFHAHRRQGEWFDYAEEIKSFLLDPHVLITNMPIPTQPNSPQEKRPREAPIYDNVDNVLLHRTKISVDEMLHRFDEAGGRVYHFKGSKACMASTIQKGAFRFRAKDHLLNAGSTLDTRLETYTHKNYNIANRILLRRAKDLPPIIPTLAGLREHLQAIDALSLPSKDEIYAAVNQWCSLIEVHCRTAEAADAFSVHRYHEILKPIYEEFAANKPQNSIFIPR